MSKVYKNSNFGAAQMVKMVGFGPQKLPKLILCKIWLAEKSLNFHIAYSQLSRLPRSVIKTVENQSSTQFLKGKKSNS